MARKPKRDIPDEQRERLKRIGYQPGTSGNPAGRPLEDDALKGKIRQKLPRMIDRLEEIAENGNNESSVVKAIEIMMSYVLPKAATKHEVDVQVTSFGDFLIQANKRHEAISHQSPVQVIEAEFEQVDENPNDSEQA
jgi:hypothetical protein